jgi:nitroreductase
MLKDTIRAALDRLDRLLVPIAASNSLLASLYYLACSRQFRREHRAVLAGRQAYARQIGGAAGPARSSPLLRRNVHRLEKGLVMQPRQPVFAEDYIGETVTEYRRCLATASLDVVEQRWAHDVLQEYFAVVTATAVTAAARAEFAAAGAASDAVVGDRGVPHARQQGAVSGVSYQQFLDLCRQRRSVRWYLPDNVPRAVVDQAVAAAAQAPSACNRQPFMFRYLERAEDAQRVARLAIGTGGYVDNIPALLVVLGDLSAYPAERDRHLIYIDAALASMQLMLALETLGLASCPINWPDIEKLERRMAKELELPWHLRPIMLIALGYPDPQGGVPFSAKKPTPMLLRTGNDYDS